MTFCGRNCANIARFMSLENYLQNDENHVANYVFLRDIVVYKRMSVEIGVKYGCSCSKYFVLKSYIIDSKTLTLSHFLYVGI